MYYIRKIFIDILLVSFTFVASFLLRFDVMIPTTYIDQIIMLLPIVIMIRIVFFLVFRIYNHDYNYFSVPNMLSILKALSSSTLIISVIFLSFPNVFRCPRSILIIDWLLGFVTICGERYLIKCLKQGMLKKEKNDNKTRVLILGAGDAGESLLREIKTHRNYNYSPVGLIDDNPEKSGKLIHGVKVIGNSKDIPQLNKQMKIEALIIAIPSATRKQLNYILQLCNDTNTKILTVPSLCEISKEKLLINQLQKVKPENVLFRKQIECDGRYLANELSGKRIMVTGAGGSIGTELCRQISKYNPDQLILFERSEYNLFCIDKELNKFSNLSIHPVVGDITDYDMTLKIIKMYKPDIIFHAAAYKHVFLMELNPEVAIRNNVMGTINIAQAAMSEHVKKLVLISSDKAVNPNCIMGATKRICENYIKKISGENGNIFFGVRFGNVLGSSGSVLQIFEEQIANGGPVTVTHINAFRYFMTIPEAVHLVLQTLTLAKGGEMFILDMGEPVRIFDLAKKLIYMSGLEPNIDIDITFTGLKQGEKLSEQLFEKDEILVPTKHKKILKIRDNKKSKNLVQLTNDSNELLTYATNMDRTALINKIKNMVPTFQSPLLEIPSRVVEMDKVKFNQN